MSFEQKATKEAKRGRSLRFAYFCEGFHYDTYSTLSILETAMNTSSHSFIAACVFAALTTLNLSAVTHYVWQSSPGPAPPYTNWATAATNIQDAVDAAAAGDEIVVTNGTYAGDSRVDPYGVTNCVVVNKPLTLRSVNGPGVTIIDGSGVVRCVYLTNDAVLVGFTLTNGVAGDGGGVYCESTSAVLSNCVLTGNWSAYDPDECGGGAYGGTLNNCTLTGNSAYDGGGAYGGTLNNCTLTGNTANGYWFQSLGGSFFVSGAGGGAYGCTLEQLHVDRQLGQLRWRGCLFGRSTTVRSRPTVTRRAGVRLPSSDRQL